MKQISKFPMVATNALFLDLPKGAEILSVAHTQGDLYLWALVDPEAELETRLLEIRETGDSVFEHAEIDRKFLGTVLAEEQEWHIFERQWKGSAR